MLDVLNTINIDKQKYLIGNKLFELKPWIGFSEKCNKNDLEPVLTIPTKIGNRVYISRYYAILVYYTVSVQKNIRGKPSKNHDANMLQNIGSFMLILGTSTLISRITCCRRVEL